MQPLVMIRIALTTYRGEDEPHIKGGRKGQERGGRGSREMRTGREYTNYQGPLILSTKPSSHNGQEIVLASTDSLYRDGQWPLSLVENSLAAFSIKIILYSSLNITYCNHDTKHNLRHPLRKAACCLPGTSPGVYNSRIVTIHH